MIMITLTVILSVLRFTSEAAKILAFYPIPSISHQVVYRTYTEELARRGHEVTVITPDPSPNAIKNLTQIDVHEMSYELWREGMALIVTQEGEDDPLGMIPAFSSTIVSILDYQLSRPEFKYILDREEDDYDLVIGEAIMPLLYALKNKFRAPVIGIGSMTPLVDVYEAVGVPTHPIVYTNVFRKNLILDTLWKKLDELRTYFRTKTILEESCSLIQNRIEKYFGRKSNTTSSLAPSVDFMILNANPLFTGIRPVGPNTLLVNGLHLKQSKKALPKDLKDFLDNATEGCVYFSLGTNVLSKDLPAKTQQVFKDAFKRLPYKVIWKYELDEMKDKPENVKIVKWIPQMDLLGHKNIRAFIMQGGQQSIDEAIFNKVPIVGLPVFGDQDINVQKVIEHGLGVGLELNSLISDELIEAVNKVVEDKSFKQKITKFSEILADQPEPPLERAIWWTEYVIRHKGAPHLRSPAAGISNWNYFMVDIVVLAAVVLVLIISLILILILILSRLRKETRIKKKID